MHQGERRNEEALGLGGAGPGRRPGPTVSVVIPTVRPDLVVGALASVAAQTWRGALEVLVVHDGKAPLALGSWPFAVRALATPQRRGPGAARNFGVHHAYGSLLAFLDDDDRWMSDHLATTVPVAAAAPAIVFTDALVHHREEGWTRPFRPRAAPDVLDRTNPVILSTVVVQRSAFCRVDGFDPTLPRYEDWDWLLRSRAAGILIRAIPTATVLYNFSARSLSADGAAMARTFSRFCARHCLHDLPVTNFAQMAQQRDPALVRVP